MATSRIWGHDPESDVSVCVTVSDDGVLVQITDECVQKHFAYSCMLAAYATESPAGEDPVRKHVARNMTPEQIAQIESEIRARLTARR